MNAASAAIAAAISFTWLGMVLAISFLEAPLKFRAPGVTLPIGLGIGRIVFRALNVVEVVLALGLLGTVVFSSPTTGVLVSAVTTTVILAVQLLAVRPVLSRRSDRVLAGEELPRSRGHYAYVALECAKVFALLAAGITALYG